MSEPLRMLFPRDGWDRIADAVSNRGLPLDSFVIERDGSYTHAGQAIDIDGAGIQAAWFSPDLFMLGQDQRFLDLLCRTPGLAWVQSGRAGFDDPAFATLARNGVRLSTSKATAPAISEFVLATVLDHFQHGPARRAAQAEQRWAPDFWREVAGSRWLLVGYGAIGREIAIRARALGAQVTGVRRSGGSDSDVDAIVTPDNMSASLSAADVVVLSVPLTADNDGAYGADFFAGIGSEALFVNVGRGQLLDDDALRAALDAGTLAHAALDVTRIEPLPSGSWQWHHPRVTLTAHVAGRGSGLNARVDAALIDNLERYLSGAPLQNELDPGVFA